MDIETLIEVARTLKLTVYRGAATTRFARRCVIYLDRCVEDQTKELAHELAHYLVAPAYRRRKPNFGIPSHTARARSTCRRKRTRS